MSLYFYVITKTNIEHQGVVERCSFEQGLCSWAESDVDTPGAEWTRHKGQEAWPAHGPPRDHTQNSAAGIRMSEALVRHESYLMSASSQASDATFKLVSRYLTGHYVIPGTHLTSKGQASEMVSKTLLRSDNCTVSTLWWLFD